MKRIISVVCLIAIISVSLVTGVFSGEAYASGGYWQLESVTFDMPAESETTSLSLSQGYASYYVKDKGTGDVFAASANWSEPADSYSAGEIVTLNLEASVDTYEWHGQEGVFHGGLNYMGYHISARFDAPDVPYGFAGNASISLKDENNENAAVVSATVGNIDVASKSLTVSAPFPTGYRDGDKICLYVSPSHTGNVRYLYTWIAEDTPAATSSRTETAEEPSDSREIWLSGIVTDIENKPMPRMKVEIDVYFDAGNYQTGASPTRQIETYTDIRGRLFEKIILPENQEKEIGILVKGSLNCILADDHESYYLVNMKHDFTRDSISAASFIRVDPSGSKHKEEQIIQVARLFSYYYLSVGAWSFIPGTNDPDFFWSNLPDNYELASASYLYNIIWDAQFYGAVILDEGTALKSSELRIETNWVKPGGSALPAVSHYSPGGTSGTLRLTPDSSKFNDISRYTILHEYGHHFDYITNGGKFRAVSLLPADAVSKNHGGYMNSNTADSFMEGFVTAFAALVQRFRRDDNPHIAGWINLGDTKNYIAWESNGQNEELAIAALLYQMSLEFKDQRDFWHLLKPNRQDFYAYYQAIETKLAQDSEKLAKLRQAAEDGGLYKMPFGNGRYDKGEPFLDKIPSGASAGNGAYDAGENFGDLMYAVDDYGWIKRGVPLRENTVDLVLGKSSDASRDRRTISRLENCFIYFDNLPVDQVLIGIYPDSGGGSRILVPVEDNKVYIPLTSQIQSGTVEISLPGGDVIYTGDLERLKEQQILTTGQKVPLDEASFTGSIDQENMLWPLPSYGSTNSDEIIELPDNRTIQKNNNEAIFRERDIDKETTLTYLADKEHKRIPSFWNKAMRWLLIITIVFLIAVIVVVSIKLAGSRKRAAVNTGNRQNTAAPYSQTGIRYCRKCGAANTAGNIYCHNCGEKRVY